jgi:phage-related baseplate assembly protein
MADDILKFTEDDPAQVLPDVVREYEDIAGRTVADADPEMLMLKTLAYRESLARNAVNHTGRQNLLKYSSGVALEEIGYEFDVQRLPASAALCTIKYFLSAGHPGALIPQDNRVRSGDGRVIFKTMADTNVPAGQQTIEILAECTTSGEDGNDYIAGDINTMLDPITYVTAAGNTDTSAGGADEETDEQLRERIRLARSAFSVAGPEDAYKVFALSASPDIVDVAVKTTNPGEVTIYPLLRNGVMPTSAVLAAVLAVCDDTKVRPLNDAVLTAAPTEISYDIEAELTLNKGAIQATELQASYDAANAFKTARANTLGLDVMRSELIRLLKGSKVYDVNLVQPAANIIADKNEYPKIGTITITVTGIANE